MAIEHSLPLATPEMLCRTEGHCYVEALMKFLRQVEYVLTDGMRGRAEVPMQVERVGQLLSVVVDERNVSAKQRKEHGDLSMARAEFHRTQTLERA